ncbi:MAG: metallophosphoesterase, partial [Myxococcota bacterium]
MARLREVDRGAPAERKLLVLSDLHLGRDHDPITGFDHHRPSPEFDQNFIALLEYYTSEEPESWRVVLDGDFLDFVEVVVRPELDTALKVAFEVTREEHTLGLGTEPERAKVKLDMIVDYHVGFFTALARFVREGGELVMVRGNHDAEMFWGKVQRELRRRLAQLAFAGQRLELDDLLEERSQFQGRIQFVPWCYVEPGRIYIEHGHQYDPYCAFDHQLYPISPLSPRRVDTPIFMFAMRYFVNRLTGFATHYKDIWTTKDYLRWLR